MNVGVDLGGTNIRAGIVQNGTLMHQRSSQLFEKDSLSSTLQQLMDLIRPLVDGLPVNGIGIGVPSVVDIEKGVVYNVANIPSWEEVALRDILEEAFDLPVFVNNDTNCFILGEHRYGLARGFRSVVGVTAGTGLGSGLIIDNQLFTGNNCGAGEIGLLPYLDQNLEHYASNQFFEFVHGTTAYETHEAALRGEPDALALWEEFGTHMGRAIMSVMYAYDPEAIVLGGSVTKAFPFFRDSMHRTIAEFAYPVSIGRLKILHSQNENIALFGAAALVPSAVQSLT